MQQNHIPFRNTNYFSNLICDYLDENPKLQPYYNRFPGFGNFKDQIKEKQASVQMEARTTLVSVLKQQYDKVNISDATLSKHRIFKKGYDLYYYDGHQLNLFTGPLYFLYKIIATIKLSEELKEQYPEYNFVPIYWMATEDHDFEEINYFNFRGRKIQ